MLPLETFDLTGAEAAKEVQGCSDVCEEPRGFGFRDLEEARLVIVCQCLAGWPATAPKVKWFLLGRDIGEAQSSGSVDVVLRISVIAEDGRHAYFSFPLITYSYQRGEWPRATAAFLAQITRS